MANRPLLFNNTQIFRPRGSLSLPTWCGITKSCMRTAWTIAALSPMEWYRVCARHSRRDERVGCFRINLMNLPPSMSNNVFHLSGQWTKYILRLSLLCTLIKQMCRGIQVYLYNSHFAMATLLTPHTSIQPRNNGCRLVWPTLEDVPHMTHPSSWAR